MIEAKLSPQQKQIMEYAVNGLRNREIAEELGIDKFSVDTQIKRVNKKLGRRDKFGSSLMILAEEIASEVAANAAANATSDMLERLAARIKGR